MEPSVSQKALPSFGPERREHRRMHVLLGVTVLAGQHQEVARVLEISASGLRVMVSPELARQMQVLVRRGDVTIPGRVVWRRGTTAGIAFDAPLGEHAFLRFRNPRHRCPTCYRMR
jgi:hypothetical protein